MNTPGTCRFDLSQMGEADKHNLSATFYEAIQRFFDDPINRKRFEDWKKQRKPL